MKKKVLLIALILAMACMGTACTRKGAKKDEGKETEEVSYTLEPVSIDNLQSGTYYVKVQDDFFALPRGTKNFDEYAKAASSDRVIAFGQDDALIPTMFADDELIYYSEEDQISSINMERFLDNGYSIGVIFLQENEAGKYSYIEGTSLVFPGTTFEKAIVSLKENSLDTSAISIDKINGTLLTEENVSDSGVFRGLKYGDDASTDVYVGTKHATIDLMADIHAFESMEVYDSNDYMMDTAGYEIINMPNYLLSGYYYINGTGLVKYINNKRRNGENNIDLNTPYYYLDGSKMITYPEYMELYGEKEEEKPKEKLDTMTADIVSGFYIDKTLEGLSVMVTCRNREDENTSIEGATAKLLAPDGEIYPVEEVDGETLSTTINGALAGDWIIAIYNLEGRQAIINTEIYTGESNSFVHATDGKGSITIPETVNSSQPAIFCITWENTNRAADVTIIDPNGFKYSKKDTPNAIVGNTYGEMRIQVDNLVKGNYTFELEGDNLGRVWIEKQQVEEKPESTEPESEEREADTEETSEAETGTE